MTEKRFITASALRLRDTIHTLPQPARHHHVRDHLIHNLKLSTDDILEAMDFPNQGFICNHGQYHTRAEALDIARAAGQVTSIIGGELTSEDLW